MCKSFGYERGLVNYFIGSLTGNPAAMYIYGGGLLALWNAWSEAVEGEFVLAVVYYFVTKYLPPWPPEQVLVQLSLGLIVASLKWYVFTPRRRSSSARRF